MTRRIKLEYPQYKALEAALKSPVELTEWTRDRMAFRKSIWVHLSDTAIEFVGPWKHKESSSVYKLLADGSENLK